MKRIIFISLFLFGLVSAQTPVLNYLTSTDGGSAYEVFYYNNYLFVGAANTLEVWDLTGPNNTPGTLRYKKRLLSNIDYITEHNGYLYVCANHDGLYKFELSLSPDSLIEKAHFVPASINESIYDMAFYGSDTIVVAAKNKLNMLKEYPDSFSFLSTIDSFTGSTRIHGLDVKNNLLAYTVGFSSILTPGQDGVYLFDLVTMTQLDFYNNDDCSPWDVCFGKNNSLLHVMGGQLGIDTKGLYYVLDYSTPLPMTLEYTDTIYPAILSIGMPMNVVNLNDTIYIATQGGRHVVDAPNTGQIYVYDATDSSSLQFLTNIYGGLYHFDLSINENNRNVYIASEWYGILTVDASDIHNEIVRPYYHTGGWCHGSATANDILVEASEGYGIRMFNTSIVQNPILIDEDTTGGFCRAVSMSDDGEHVFAWYLTGESFRVYDGDTLILLADESVNHTATDFKKSRYFNNKVAVIDEIQILIFTVRRIAVADVTNPLTPTFIYRNNNSSGALQDLGWHSSGKLIACAHDSLLVLGPTMNLVTFAQPPGGLSFKALAVSGDTIFVFGKKPLLNNDSIITYYYDDASSSLTQIGIAPHSMNAQDRIFIAADSGYIYISSTIDQLKALSKSSISVLATYNHGADHMYDNLWGVHDLYCKNGYVFLNEYMGQTSIFGAPNTVSIDEEGENDHLIVYPNPANHFFTIDIGSFSESKVQIFSIEGKLMYSADLLMDKINLSTMGWESGVYLINIEINGHRKNAKLIVTK